MKNLVVIRHRQSIIYLLFKVTNITHSGPSVEISQFNCENPYNGTSLAIRDYRGHSRYISLEATYVYKSVLCQLSSNSITKAIDIKIMIFTFRLGRLSLDFLFLIICRSQKQKHRSILIWTDVLYLLLITSCRIISVLVY